MTQEYGLRSRINGTSLSLLEVPPGLGFRDNQSVPQFTVIAHLGRPAPDPAFGRRHPPHRRRRAAREQRRLLQLQRLHRPDRPAGFGRGTAAGDCRRDRRVALRRAGGPAHAGPAVAEYRAGVLRPGRLHADAIPDAQSWPSLQLLRRLRGNVRSRRRTSTRSTRRGASCPTSTRITYGVAANVMAPVDRRSSAVSARPQQLPAAGRRRVERLRDGGKSVVRAAYGTYADRPFQGLWDFGVLNYPFATSLSVFNLPFQIRDLPIAGQPTQTRLIDPALRSPMTQRFNVDVRAADRPHTSASAPAMSARAATDSTVSTSRMLRPKCRRTAVPIRALRAPGSSPTPRRRPTTRCRWSARHRLSRRAGPDGRLHVRELARRLLDDGVWRAGGADAIAHQPRRECRRPDSRAVFQVSGCRGRSTSTGGRRTSTCATASSSATCMTCRSARRDAGCTPSPAGWSIRRHLRGAQRRAVQPATRARRQRRWECVFRPTGAVDRNGAGPVCERRRAHAISSSRRLRPTCASACPSPINDPYAMMQRNALRGARVALLRPVDSQADAARVGAFAQPRAERVQRLQLGRTSPRRSKCCPTRASDRSSAATRRRIRGRFSLVRGSRSDAVRHIVRHELRDVVRDGRFRWASAVVLALLCVALLTGLAYQRAVAAEHASAARHVAGDLARAVGEGSAHGGALRRLRVQAARPVDARSTAASTTTPASRRGSRRTSRTSSSSGPHRIARRSRGSASSRRPSRCNSWCPVLILLLAFTKFAGEREDGTLRQLAGRRRPAGVLAAGKAAGVAAALGLVLRRPRSSAPWRCVWAVGSAAMSQSICPVWRRWCSSMRSTSRRSPRSP